MITIINIISQMQNQLKAIKSKYATFQKMIQTGATTATTTTTTTPIITTITTSNNIIMSTTVDTSSSQEFKELRKNLVKDIR